MRSINNYLEERQRKPGVTLMKIIWVGVEEFMEVESEDEAMEEDKEVVYVDVKTNKIGPIFFYNLHTYMYIGGSPSLLIL